MTNKAHFAVVTSTYRQDVIDMQFEGATAELDKAGVSYDRIQVSGALEIPAAVSLLQKSGKVQYDGYVVLGCIIKGETIHDEVIAYTAFKALDEIARAGSLPIGNGILTVNTKEQAIARGDVAQQNRGGEAAKAALCMYDLGKDYGVLA